jgi:hypothetical protein
MNQTTQAAPAKRIYSAPRVEKKRALTSATLFSGGSGAASQG